MNKTFSEGFRILVLDENIQEDNFAPDFAVFNKFPVDRVHEPKQVVERITLATKKNLPYAVIVLYMTAHASQALINQLEKMDSHAQILVVLDQHDENLPVSKPQENLLYLRKPLDVMMLLQAIFVLLTKWQVSKKKRQQSLQFDRELKERLEQLVHQATHDTLTDLPNRTMFLQELNRLIRKAKRAKSGLAVFFLDLDRFKMVNDSLSHLTGDKVLQQIAERLKQIVKPEDVICRIGGDEFAMVCSEMNDKSEISAFAQKILKTIQDPLRIGSHELSLTTSVGIALYPQDEQNAELLYRNADTAMYQAKEKGPNFYEFYSSLLNHNSLERLAFENELYRALKNDEFVLHYQPEINLHTHEVMAVEALVRWRHPQKGLVSPLDFIPAAVATGLILPIGEWVLKNACKQNKVWQEKKLLTVPIAVNVSGLQFEQKDLLQIVKEALSETKLLPQFLEIELNENIIFRHGEFVDLVKKLRKMGIRIALDDFGVGNSILNNIRMIPIDVIKIDKSFVEHIGQDIGDEAIIKSIIAIGKTLEFHVLAEGVETREQLEFIKREGCDSAQGFYFSKPLLPDELEKFVESHRKK